MPRGDIKPDHREAEARVLDILTTHVRAKPPTPPAGLGDLRIRDIAAAAWNAFSPWNRRISSRQRILLRGLILVVASHTRRNTGSVTRDIQRRVGAANCRQVTLGQYLRARRILLAQAEAFAK